MVFKYVINTRTRRNSKLQPSSNTNLNYTEKQRNGLFKPDEKVNYFLLSNKNSKKFFRINSFSEKLKAYRNDKLSNTLEELENMRKIWLRAGDYLCSDPAGGFHHYMWAY